MKESVRGTTFAMVPKWVLTHPDLTYHAVVVYALLAWRIGRDKERALNVAWIIDQIGGSKRSHQMALQALETVGAISRHPEYDSAHGGQVGNVYHVHFDQPRGASVAPPRASNGTGAHATSGTPSTTDVRALEVPSEPAPPQEAPARPDHRLLFGALLQATGWQQQHLTATASGRVGRAAKELGEIGVTPEEISAFAIFWKLHYGDDVDLTPTAISNNWAAYKAGTLFTERRARR